MSEKNDFQKLVEKYPHRVPVIIKTIGGLKLKKYKYLVPRDLCLFDFQIYIRKNLSSLGPNESIFMFINEKIYPLTEQLDMLWAKENENFCLYITISKENTFGNG